MEHIIYLEADDDIAVMRDRLEWAQAHHVVLVVPRRNRELRSLVNLKLLARHARNYSRRVALVTNDPRIIQLSREAKLVTFGSVERAQRSRWLSEDGAEAELAPSPSSESLDLSALPAEEAVETSLELPERPVKDVPRPRRLPRFRPRHDRRIARPLLALGFLILLALAAVTLAAAAVLIYPEGRIQLAPATQEISAELLVHANPEIDHIDYTTLEIPARLVQVEIRDVGRIPPTTTEDMPADKARGTVTFVNRTDQEITIPMSTTLTTSSGTNVRFLTLFTATVPAAFNAAAQAEVLAIDPGPIGNVPAGQINRISNPVLERQLTVVNEAAAGGGSVAPAGVVTRADKDRLQAIVLQQIQQGGYSQLQEGLAEQEFIPPESLIVIPLDFSYDPSMDGEVTTELTLEMRAVVRGTAIAGQNANQLALAALQSNVPPGYSLDARSLQFVAGETVEVRDRAVNFRMQASGVGIAQIDGRQVASDVRGLPTEEALHYLRQQLPLAAEPLVVVEPDWLGRLPWFPFRINVEVTE